MNESYRFLYVRIATNVSRVTGLVLSDSDVARLLDLGKGTGSPDADRLIEQEAREYGIGAA